MVSWQRFITIRIVAEMGSTLDERADRIAGQVKQEGGLTDEARQQIIEVVSLDRPKSRNELGELGDQALIHELLVTE